MEGFCLPVLEGQRFGVPVVCSDIPVLREVAGKGARFFDPRDSSDMASAIRDVSQAHVGNGAVRFMLRMLKGVDDVLLGALPGLGRYCGECVAVYWK